MEQNLAGPPQEVMPPTPVDAIPTLVIARPSQPGHRQTAPTVTQLPTIVEEPSPTAAQPPGIELNENVDEQQSPIADQPLNVDEEEAEDTYEELPDIFGPWPRSNIRKEYIMKISERRLQRKKKRIQACLVRSPLPDTPLVLERWTEEDCNEILVSYRPLTCRFIRAN